MKSKVSAVLRNIMDKLNNNLMLQAIRKGMVVAIPVLLIGSMAMVISSLPIPGYQRFITSLLGGKVNGILELIRQCTSDMIAVIIVITTSYSYVELKKGTASNIIGVPILSFISFLMLSGIGSAEFTTGRLGVRGVGTAIAATAVTCLLYGKVSKIRFLQRRGYADGADITFNSAVGMILPGLAVILLVAAGNEVMQRIFRVDCFQALFNKAALWMMSGTDGSLLNAVLYMFGMHLLWFFGIHGSNVFEDTAQQMFSGALIRNQEAAAAGQVPPEILTRQFFDMFTVVGGCGFTIGLLVAIYLFAKQRNLKNLARFGTIPVLFNINELLIFGIPVVFNPIFFIPFLLTPIVLVIVTYTACSLGLVSPIIEQVNWTTPVFLSGYLTTGSISGAIMQLVNVIIGAAIYAPFIKWYEKNTYESMKRDTDQLIQILKEQEEVNERGNFLERGGKIGSVAKNLAGDLKHAMKTGQLELHYQMQVDKEGEAMGAEALLRWKHPLIGYVYPPMIIELARESGFLLELEEQVFHMAFCDLKKINSLYGSKYKISVNLTADSLRTSAFEQYLKKEMEGSGIIPETLWIEITEQTALSGTASITERLKRINQLGAKLAIDDFGMGHTSLIYLETNEFNVVKLDGSLTRNVLDNKRCSDIISSISNLGSTLNFSIIAEYVETREQYQKLVDLGCNGLQGYLISRPVPFDDLMGLISDNKKES